MVSTIRFPHIGNTLFGRLGFRTIIIGMLLVSLLVAFPYWFLAVLTSLYVLLGLGLAVVDMWRKWRAGRHPLDEPEDDEAEDVGVATDRFEEGQGPRPGR
jgi:hypothetical protein